MAADHDHEMIPGLFDSGSQDESNHNMSLSAPMSMSAVSSRSILDELLAEKGSLGPNFAHSIRLLDEEIIRVKSGDKNIGKGYFLMDGSKIQTERIYIPMELQKQHNVVGRLLGPKGMILKGIQNETRTRISILGRGSIKDRKKEEDMRNSNDPQHAHLKDELHVQIEATPPISHIKLAAGVAEINKMLVPPPIGEPDAILARYLNPNMMDGYGNVGGPPRNMQSPSPRGRGGVGGRGGGSRGGGGRGGGGRGGGGRGGGIGGRGGGRGGGGRGGGGGGRDSGGGGRGARGSGMARPFEREDRSASGRGYSGGGGGHPVDPYPDSYADPDRDSRDRYYREERRSLSDDYGRPSTDTYSGDPDSYYSFSDKLPSRASSYGGHEDSVGYSHSSTSSDWKTSRPSRREGARHHPYSQGSGGYM